MTDTVTMSRPYPYPYSSASQPHPASATAAYFAATPTNPLSFSALQQGQHPRDAYDMYAHYGSLGRSGASRTTSGDRGHGYGQPAVKRRSSVFQLPKMFRKH